MKLILSLLLISLCGCRTAAPVPVLPPPTLSMPDREPAMPVAPGRLPLPPPDPRSRQQAQLIEALINQNDALAARLAATQSVPASLPVPAFAAARAATPTPVMVPSPLSPGPVDSVPFIAPNAEGMIDLAAIESAAIANEPVNPFAVRTTPDGKTRELSLIVGGIILGRAPCAMVNERLIQPGDSVEGLEVERIEAGAVIVRRGPHRLRLPVSPAPTRVRVSL